MTSPVDLFSALRIGALDLPNRVVMAPMTRSRAIGGVPNALMRDYYAQRASAGLIVSEGIAPSPSGLGYARIPGLFSDAQVAGWRTVTDAVHAAGGRIIAQLMHVGRIGHPLNQAAGARLLAPSAVAASGTMWTDQEGPRPFPVPAAMTLDDIAAARDEFVQAARHAIAAGFDGVELHSANGYLLEQFLHPHTNRRDDEYRDRNRFVVEVAGAVAAAIGAERVGVRLSPYGTFNDLPLHDGVHAQYAALAAALRGLLYLHLVGNGNEQLAATAEAIRAGFGGPIIRNGGYDRARADETLRTGAAELISFGRPFIANPDLVARMRNGAALAAPDPQTFYTADARGYLDYPAIG
jgi:N-ethylmaleimide reductase